MNASTAENLPLRLETMKADWRLEGKIKGFVRDNSANPAAAARQIDDWEDLACFAHILQHAVSAGFAIEEVKDIISKCGELVGFFKKQTMSTTAIEAAQGLFKVAKHPFIQSYKKRWKSVYELFHCLVEQKQAVLSSRNFVSADKAESLSLTAAQ